MKGITLTQKAIQIIDILLTLKKNSRLKELHRTNGLAQRKIAHLPEKLKEVIEIEGEQVDEATHSA